MDLINYIIDAIKTIVISTCIISSTIGAYKTVKNILPTIYYNTPIIISEPNKPIITHQGTKGRLIFDNYNYSVALYESNQYNAQILVDDEDSAAWITWNGNRSPIIADHCTQGFDVICKCNTRDTCQIINGNYCQKYKCIEVDHNGVNTGYGLFLSSGYNFFENNDSGYLYMYTCNQAGDSYHITVAIWVPIYEENDDYITIIENEEDYIEIIDDS